MSRLVLDSSVVIKWFVPEVHSNDALRYLDPTLERHAPELLLAEASNILWKKAGRGELTPAEADTIAREVGQADIQIHSMTTLFIPGLQFALATQRTAYDSIYLTLADSLATRVVTADRRFFNALQGGPYAHLILWVEDGP